MTSSLGSPSVSWGKSSVSASALHRWTKWISICAVAAYAVLFCAMWMPVLLLDNEGWLFLFPVFIVLWVPTQLAAFAAVVLGAIGISQPQLRHLRSKLSLVIVLTAVFVLVSLPALWFGAFLPNA